MNAHPSTMSRSQRMKGALGEQKEQGARGRERGREREIAHCLPGEDMAEWEHCEQGDAGLSTAVAHFNFVHGARTT